MQNLDVFCHSLYEKPACPLKKISTFLLYFLEVHEKKKWIFSLWGHQHCLLLCTIPYFCKIFIKHLLFFPVMFTTVKVYHGTGSPHQKLVISSKFLVPEDTDLTRLFYEFGAFPEMFLRQWQWQCVVWQLICFMNLKSASPGPDPDRCQQCHSIGQSEITDTGKSDFATKTQRLP